MSIWSVGLATRASAERAYNCGRIACLLQAARLTIGTIANANVADKPLDNAIAWFIGASLLPILLVVAGIHTWRGGGWLWGGLATLLVALDLAMFSPAPTSIRTATSLVVKFALLALMINGVRGALALRKLDCPKDVRSTSS